jgi:hypothetical protein
MDLPGLCTDGQVVGKQEQEQAPDPKLKGQPQIKRWSWSFLECFWLHKRQVKSSDVLIK